MKPKKIQNNLRIKLNKFIESIDDLDLKESINKNTIITGGSIASMLTGEPINDYDLYFTDKETTLKAAKYFCKKAINDKVANMFVLTSDDAMVRNILKINIEEKQKQINKEIEASKKEDKEEGDSEDKLSYECDIALFDCMSDIQIYANQYQLCWRLIHNIYHTFKNDPNRIKIYSAGSWGTNGKIQNKDEKIDSQEVEDEQEGKYEVKFISANAITLSDKIQLVIRFYGDAEEIHKNFDYVHATNYWTSSDNKLYTNAEALESLLGKYLIYKGSKYPLASIFRSRKFIYRDWHIDAGQYLKMVFQLNDLDLNDPYILEEQLTGVDLLYFNWILNDFKSQKMKDTNFKPTTNYFIKIIEKVFE